MRVLQLTMTGAPVQILVPNPQNPQANIAVTMLVIQPNTAAATLGDNTVTATKGIVIPAAAIQEFTFNTARGSLLSQYWLYGTSGDTVTILYETAQ